MSRRNRLFNVTTSDFLMSQKWVLMSQKTSLLNGSKKKVFQCRNKWIFNTAKKKKGFSNITKNELLWCREEISFLMSQQIDFQCRSKWCKFRRNLMEDSNFEDLLIKDSSWTIHENNIHTLLIEKVTPYTKIT